VTVPISLDTPPQAGAQYCVDRDPPWTPVARTTRTWPSPTPNEPIVLAPLPEEPESPHGGWWQLALPATGGLAMLGYALMAHSLALLVLSATTLVLSVAAAGLTRQASVRRARRESLSARARYRTHLDDAVQAAAAAGRRQRASLLELHPELRALPTLLAERCAIWLRRSTESDHLHVRIGLGRVNAVNPLVLSSPPGPLSRVHPELAGSAEGAVFAAATVDDCPLMVDLAAGPLAIRGPAASVAALARALVVHLTVHHPPDEVSVQIHPTADDDWAWCEKLPHRGTPAAVTMNLIDARDRASSQDRESSAAGPAIVLLPTDAPWPAGMASVATVDGDGAVQLRRCSPDAHPVTVARPDQLSTAVAEHLADLMSGLQPASNLTARGASEFAEPPASTLTELLPVPDVAGPDAGPPRGPLATPVGRRSDGQVLWLDLAEPAEGGDGPHGMVIGATGSGKSELLRTLISGLAVRSSPQQVAFVLIDFKGGAAFDALRVLPHVAGCVTNLDLEEPDSEQDPEADPAGPLIHRVIIGLRAEVRRRQRVLRDAAVSDLRAYRSQPESAHRPALPNLIIVIDEVAELVTDHPEVMDLVTMLCRVGRSLGIHLILAGQRLADGRLRSLDGLLRFRLCLRTFSAEESINVLGDGRAAALPPLPGLAFLAVEGPPQLFRAARSHEPALDQCRLGAGPAAPIWPAPLPRMVNLADLLDASTTPGSAPGSAPVGWAEDPQDARQSLLTVRPQNFAVIGGSGSGKTTALLTLTIGLASSRRPDELTIAVLGNDRRLAALRALPHVSVVAGLSEQDLLAAALQEVETELQARQRGGTQQPPAFLLVVDDWATLRELSPGAFQLVTAVATHGPRVGMHVAIAANRWADLRPSIKPTLARWIELRVADPTESELPRQVRVPARRPGRGALPDGSLVQIAQPESGRALTVQVAEVAARAVGAPLRRVLALPSHIQMPPAPRADGQIWLGVTGPRLVPVFIHLPGRGGHLLVIGGPGSGRTNALALLAGQLPEGTSSVRLIDDYDLLPQDDLPTLPDPVGAAATVVLAGTPAGLAQRGFDPLMSRVRGGPLNVLLLAGADGDPALAASGLLPPAMLRLLGAGSLGAGSAGHPLSAGLGSGPALGAPIGRGLFLPSSGRPALIQLYRAAEPVTPPAPPRPIAQIGVLRTGFDGAGGAVRPFSRETA
jgi:S-DNA-T family DNA segregation ATPase FtsK/SpoIIIE